MSGVFSVIRKSDLWSLWGVLSMCCVPLSCTLCWRCTVISLQVEEVSRRYILSQVSTVKRRKREGSGGRESACACVLRACLNMYYNRTWLKRSPMAKNLKSCTIIIWSLATWSLNSVEVAALRSDHYNVVIHMCVYYTCMYIVYMYVYYSSDDVLCTRVDLLITVQYWHISHISCKGCSHE